MAYIRIPTGQYTATATVTKTSFLYYQCLYCGKDALTPLELKGVGQQTYHALNSQATKDARREAAAEGAQQNAAGADLELFNAVNVKKEYGALKRKIVCPHCGKRQPWSEVGDFLNSPYRFVWLALVAVFLIMTMVLWVRTMSAAMPMYALPAASLVATVCVAAFFPLLHSYKNAVRYDQFRGNPAFVPPVYYNATNLDELLRSPAAPLVAEYLREKNSRQNN